MGSLTILLEVWNIGATRGLETNMTYVSYADVMGRPDREFHSTTHHF